MSSVIYHVSFKIYIVVYKADLQVLNQLVLYKNYPDNK